MSAEAGVPGAARAEAPVRRIVVGLALIRVAKRSLDVVVSAGLLVLLMPLLVALAVVVRLDSPGACFFRCDRVGHRGRPLRMLKFRKMRCDAAGAPLTQADDARFTRIGRWLARYKLDELPQLWHVLRGEMSLVGPRPESPTFVELHAADYRDHILTVKPGVVGLSQIAFAAEGSVLDPQRAVAHYTERILPQKVALDRMYAERLSLLLDCRILFWAAITVVGRQPVAVNRTSGAMTLRRR